MTEVEKNTCTVLVLVAVPAKIDLEDVHHIAIASFTSQSIVSYKESPIPKAFVRKGPSTSSSEMALSAI